MRTRVALLRARLPGLSTLLVAQFLPIASNLLTLLGTSFLLQPEGRGQLAYAITVCTLGGAVLFGSLHVGATADDAHPANGLRSAIFLSLVSGSLPIVAALALSLSGRGSGQIIVLAGGCMLLTINLTLLRCVQALGFNKDFRNSWAIQSVGFCLAGLGTAYITRDWRVVFAAWLVAILASTLYSLRKFIAECSRTPQGVGLTGRVLRMSVKAHFGSIGMQILYRADLIVLGIVSTKPAVAFYSLAVSSLSIIWSVAEAFALSAFQRRTEDDRVGVDRDRALLQLNLVISIVSAVAIVSVASVGVPRLLPEYVPAISLIAILSVGVVVQSPARIALASMTRQGRYKPVVLIGASAIILSFGYWPSVAAYGATGAAWYSSAAYVALGVVCVYLWQVGRRIGDQNERA